MLESEYIAKYVAELESLDVVERHRKLLDLELPQHLGDEIVRELERRHGLDVVERALHPPGDIPAGLDRDALMDTLFPAHADFRRAAEPRTVFGNPIDERTDLEKLLDAALKEPR